jgi:mRNA interferase RelE/StbE
MYLGRLKMHWLTLKQNESNAVYKVQLSNRAAKSLEKLPDGVYSRLTEAIRDLTNNPRPAGCKKLKGEEGYRI